MSESAKITLARLRKMAGPEVERLLVGVTEAINQAPDGAVTAGSEEAVREAMGRFQKRVYELGIQLRTDAAKAVFPPREDAAGRRLRNKAPQAVSALTVNRTIEVRRLVYAVGGGGTGLPLDAWLGIVTSRVSVGARELSCRATLGSLNSIDPAETLWQLAQIRVGKKRLHEITEAEGRRVTDDAEWIQRQIQTRLPRALASCGTLRRWRTTFFSATIVAPSAFAWRTQGGGRGCSLDGFK